MVTLNLSHKACTDLLRVVAVSPLSRGTMTTDAYLVALREQVAKTLADPANLPQRHAELKEIADKIPGMSKGGSKDDLRTRIADYFKVFVQPVPASTAQPRFSFPKNLNVWVGIAIIVVGLLVVYSAYARFARAANPAGDSSAVLSQIKAFEQSTATNANLAKEYAKQALDARDEIRELLRKQSDSGDGEEKLADIVDSPNMPAGPVLSSTMQVGSGPEIILNWKDPGAAFMQLGNMSDPAVQAKMVKEGATSKHARVFCVSSDPGRLTLVKGDAAVKDPEVVQSFDSGDSGFLSCVVLTPENADLYVRISGVDYNDVNDHYNTWSEVFAVPEGVDPKDEALKLLARWYSDDHKPHWYLVTSDSVEKDPQL